MAETEVMDQREEEDDHTSSSKGFGGAETLAEAGEGVERAGGDRYPPTSSHVSSWKPCKTHPGSQDQKSKAVVKLDVKDL